MPTNDWSESLPPKVRQEIETAYHRVNNMSAADRLWERVLTDRQKRCLGGNFESVYRDSGGTIGIWLKLYRCSEPRAVVEVAHALHFIDAHTRDWLLRESGTKEEAIAQDIWPQWDPDRGELRFEGQVVRKVRIMSQPSGIQMILDAFESAGWPVRIENPLGSGDAPQIHEALRSLNGSLRRLKFRSQEGGSAVTWELLENPVKSQ